MQRMNRFVTINNYAPHSSDSEGKTRRTLKLVYGGVRTVNLRMMDLEFFVSGFPLP